MLVSNILLTDMSQDKLGDLFLWVLNWSERAIITTLHRPAIINPQWWVVDPLQRWEYNSLFLLNSQNVYQHRTNLGSHLLCHSTQTLLHYLIPRQLAIQQRKLPNLLSDRPTDQPVNQLSCLYKYKNLRAIRVDSSNISSLFESAGQNTVGWLDITESCAAAGMLIITHEMIDYLGICFRDFVSNLIDRFPQERLIISLGKTADHLQPLTRGNAGLRRQNIGDVSNWKSRGRWSGTPRQKF